MNRGCRGNFFFSPAFLIKIKNHSLSQKLKKIHRVRSQFVIASVLGTKINLLVVVPSVRLALRDYFHVRLMSVSDNCKLQMMGSSAQHRKAIPQKPAGPRRANSQPDTMVNNAVVPPIPTVP